MVAKTGTSLGGVVLPDERGPASALSGWRRACPHPPDEPWGILGGRRGLLHTLVDCGFEHPSEGRMPVPRPHPPKLAACRAARRRALARPPTRSPARAHPPGHPGCGRPVPGQVQHGQEGSVRAGHAAADCAGQRTGGRWPRATALVPGIGAGGGALSCAVLLPGDRLGHVPHAGAGLPHQQGVRALLQVHARRQGWLPDRGGRGRPAPFCARRCPCFLGACPSRRTRRC